MRIVKVKKNNLFLLILAALGVIFLLIGWFGIPQNMTGKTGNDNDPAPAATLVDNEEKSKQEEEVEGSGQEMADALEEPLEEELSIESDYFTDYRLERQHIRGRQIEMLRGIINNPESTGDMRDKAQQRIMEIYQKIDSESELENLIRAKGISDAIVFIGEENVSVVVKDENIASEEATRVYDLVARGTDVTEQDIVIIPKRSQE